MLRIFELNYACLSAAAEKLRSSIRMVRRPTVGRHLSSDDGLRAKLLGRLKRLRSFVRSAKMSCWLVVDDLTRTFLMVFVLQPAADLLSRDRALKVALWCASVMLHIPSSGKSAVTTMKTTFLMEDSEAMRSAREYLAQPFCSFLVFRRLLRSREHPDEWKIEETNSQEVTKLRESGQSFIVATAHFRRESHVVLHTPRVSPGCLATVSVRVPPRSLRPQIIRTRVQFGQLLRVERHIRPDSEFVYVGTGENAMEALIKHLGEPRRQVIVSIDAFWKRRGRYAHARAFAGMRDRPFSIGSAALSRITQCPIAPCATYLKSDGTPVVEWGPVIPPPPVDDEAADIQNANLTLDFIESAIGRRPCQYTLYIGESRVWNSTLKQWEDPNCDLSVPAQVSAPEVQR